MCQVFLSMATPKGAKAVIVTKQISFALYYVCFPKIAKEGSLSYSGILNLAKNLQYFLSHKFLGFRDIGLQYFEETDNFEMCAFHKLQRKTLSCKIVGNFNQGGGGSPKR